MKKKIPSEAEVINKIVLGSEHPEKNPPDPAKARLVESSANTTPTSPTTSTSSTSSASSAASKHSSESSLKASSTPKKRTFSIIVFALGLATLIAGIVILVLNLLARPATLDAEYLVSTGSWSISNEPSVIWSFTEVGKGTLTTNNHTNDYNFLWSIEGDKITIETDWLYTLDNTYRYKLDQQAGVLTLYTDNDEILCTFIPAETPSDTTPDSA